MLILIFPKRLLFNSPIHPQRLSPTSQRPSFRHNVFLPPSGRVYYTLPITALHNPAQYLRTASQHALALQRGRRGGHIHSNAPFGYQILQRDLHQAVGGRVRTIWSVHHLSCGDILTFSWINCWLTDAIGQLALKASTRWVEGSESRPFETGVLFFKVNTKGVLYTRVIIFRIIVVCRISNGWMIGGQYFCVVTGILWLRYFALSAIVILKVAALWRKSKLTLEPW